MYLKGIDRSTAGGGCFQPIWNILEIFPMDQGEDEKILFETRLNHHQNNGNSEVVTLSQTTNPTSHELNAFPCWNTNQTWWRDKGESISQPSPPYLTGGLGGVINWRGHLGMRVTPFRSHENWVFWHILGSKMYDLVHCCGLLGSILRCNSLSVASRTSRLVHS